MIRSIRCAAVAAIILVLCMGLCLSASAADFPDVEEHWARSEMLNAVEKGWLAGFDDGTLRPDETATGAQVVTILCRVLDAQTGSGTGEEWYADAAAKAAALGIIEPGETLTEPVTRQRALRMMSEAFQLYDAAEDTSCLNNFSDAVYLPKAERAPIAALVNKGYISGYDNSLLLSSKLTRAELCAILSRIFTDSEMSLDGSVSGWTGDTLWIGCGSGDVSLDKVTADTVVVRTQGLKELTLKDCEIGTLVLAQDGDINMKWPEGTALRVGAGSGKVKLTGRGSTFSVTGDGREVELSGAPEALYISGKNTHVTLSAATELAVVGGAGSTLTVNVRVDELEINAENVTVNGIGTVTSAIVRAPGAVLPERVSSTEEIDPGLEGASVRLNHPDILPIGETLVVSAEVLGAREGLSGVATWTVDGETVKSEPAILGQSMAISRQYTYSRDMVTTSHITFRFDYVTNFGERQSVSAELDQKLQNYDKSYYDEIDTQRVLGLVTCGYLGDGTTAWAEQNDYSARDKELWVNAKGFDSTSQYLIWINKTYQRVNIFEGYQGNWKLISSGMVCTGAGDDPAKWGNKTPEGVWKVTYKETSWPFGTYICRPIVRFYGGGIAMHSRLYAYNGELYDGTIGVPASHGCVRMMDEQIYFIYENVPAGSTVVVY